MLNEQQIQQLPAQITYRLEKLNSDVLEDLGKRIKDIGELLPSDAHKLQQMQLTGADTAQVQRELAKVTALNEADIYKIFEQVAVENLNFSKSLYLAQGLKYVPYEKNAAMQRYVKAMAKQTADTYINMSQTTGFLIRNAKGEVIETSLSKTYQNVIDRAVTAVSTGTTSYNAEMKRTINDLADSGLRVLNNPNGSSGQVVDYKTGYHRRLDTAVRQNILWGVKTCNQGISDLVGEEIGADGYEISYHSNPRPSHAAMGGQMYVIGKARKVDGVYYQSFSDVEDLLQDYGCLHFKYSVLLGVSKPSYSSEQLAEYKANDIKTIEFEDKEYTGYEATQLQRKLEASMRNSNDRYTLAKSAGNTDVMSKEKLRTTQLSRKYKKFSEKAGLPLKAERIRRKA